MFIFTSQHSHPILHVAASQINFTPLLSFRTHSDSPCQLQLLNKKIHNLATTPNMHLHSAEYLHGPSLLPVYNFPLPGFICPLSHIPLRGGVPIPHGNKSTDTSERVVSPWKQNLGGSKSRGAFEDSREQGFRFLLRQNGASSARAPLLTVSFNHSFSASHFGRSPPNILAVSLQGPCSCLPHCSSAFLSLSYLPEASCLTVHTHLFLRDLLPTTLSSLSSNPSVCFT